MLKTLNQLYKDRIAKGEGRGNWDHAGRPGMVGGSAPAGGGGEGKPEGWSPVKEGRTSDKIIEKIPFSGKPLNPSGLDTRAMFKGEDGKWTTERQEFHDKISDKHFVGKTPVDKPVAYLMGGGPASGKSEFIKSGFGEFPENSVFVDSDKIKGEFPEYQKMLEERNQEAAAFSHEESSELSKDIVDRAVAGKYNSVLDGTGDNNIDNLEAKINKMRASGSPIIAHYTTIDVTEALARNIYRAGITGRLVKEEFIRSTYRSISTVVPLAIQRGLYDKFTLWDTMKQPPTKIASAEKTNLVIHDKAKWEHFLAGKDR